MARLMENQHLRHTYVPAFDGLRALVLVVMFTHLEGFFPIFETHRRLNVLLFSQAWYALNVFFCLSGFLITWILSAELLKTGDLDLTRFYQRRTVVAVARLHHGDCRGGDCGICAGAIGRAKSSGRCRIF